MRVNGYPRARLGEHELSSLDIRLSDYLHWIRRRFVFFGGDYVSASIFGSIGVMLLLCSFLLFRSSPR
jgi:hypothetical protein